MDLKPVYGGLILDAMVLGNGKFRNGNQRRSCHLRKRSTGQNIRLRKPRLLISAYIYWLPVICRYH